MQFTLDVGPDTSPTLENFYLDPSPSDSTNVALHQHLRLWLGDSAQAKRTALPLYIWGERASGKSHLLRAVAKGLAQRGQAYGWLDSAQSNPSRFDETWQAVLMDDVDQYNAEQQHAAFNWFIHAQAVGAGVIATGHAPPSALLGGVRADLRSRLGWGDVYALAALSESAVQAVLRQSAKARGLSLGEDVLSYLTTRFSRDMSTQMQWLDRLDAYALMTKRAMTLPLLKQMMHAQVDDEPRAL